MTTWFDFLEAGQAFGGGRKVTMVVNSAILRKKVSECREMTCMLAFFPKTTLPLSRRGRRDAGRKKSLGRTDRESRTAADICASG